MDSLLLSLVGFSVAMYITPGPNNVMIAASAANHGIRATVPHMFGIAFGFAGMLVVVCGGLGSALLTLPWLLPAFRWVGAAWLAMLAWQIASAPPPGEGGRGRVLGFFGAAAFQWINPKAWLIGFAAAGEYLSLHQSLLFQLVRIFLVFLVVGMPCLLVWAFIGSGARRLLRSPARVRTFNVAMGLLLVASVLPVLFEGW
ncbi:MAG TPA: LysE family translocator [Acetobacteraceae bacterium]|jgi:threonine/homoserine/homoserine lactone efflux protein|nr:LysE family translocator [Acetobacteraceae bacterium]